MKRLGLSLVLLGAVAWFQSARAAQPTRGLNTLPQRNLVLGYINYLRAAPYAQELTNLNYAALDIIAHAFAHPQTNGSIMTTNHPLLNYRPTLLSQAHARGKAVVLSLFGNFEFKAIGSNAALRTTFASNALALVQNLGYDGVDIDYEFPSSATHRANFTLLMQELYQVFKAASSNYLVTFYASPGFYIGQYDWNVLGQYSDLVTYSGYGWENPANAPLINPGGSLSISGGGSIESSMRGALNYMLSRGYPAHKILVGLPFYSPNSQSWFDIRPMWVTNRAFYATQIHSSWAEVEIGGTWWNTPEALNRKADRLLVPGQSVLTNGTILRGLGIWELGHEAASNPDLSRAMGEWIITNTVRLVAPSAIAVAGTPALLSAAAANPVGGLARMEFYLGGARIAQTTNAPGTATWSNATWGTHTLTARAVYADGLSFTSAPGTVVVRNPALQTLLARGGVWNYWDGASVASGWPSNSFSDGTWRTGIARFGYGGDGEFTTIGFGPDPNNKFTTAWFRRWFNVPNPAQFTELLFQLARDDGAVVYLNGREVFRSNLPEGPLTASTLALSAVGNADETTFFEQVHFLPSDALVAGNNLVAVALYQAATNSSDAGFDLQIVGTGTNTPRLHLAAPADGQTVPLGGRIDAEAYAWPGFTGTIDHVEFLVDGQRVSDVFAAPWRASWLAQRVGLRQLTARAVLGSGLAVTSAPRAIVVAPVTPASAPLISPDAAWRFLDNGSNAGTNWSQPGYNDTTWRSGPARLGYGGDGEMTLVNFGPNPTNKFITTYFRRTFAAPALTAMTNLVVRLQRDDGVVAWLDGRELFRTNMPPGPVGYTTLAAAAVGGADEQTWFTHIMPVPPLSGSHLLAVEVHQSSADSTDLGFALELTGGGYVSELSVPAPSLAIVRIGTDLEISWDGLASGWRLISNAQVDAPASGWSVARWTPMLNASRFVVRVPMTNATQFYRLISE